MRTTITITDLKEKIEQLKTVFEIKTTSKLIRKLIELEYNRQFNK